MTDDTLRNLFLIWCRNTLLYPPEKTQRSPITGNFIDPTVQTLWIGFKRGYQVGAHK